jgi:hypothetical protein
MATVAVVDDVQGDHGTCMQVQMLGSKCEIGEMKVYLIRVSPKRRHPDSTVWLARQG